MVANLQVLLLIGGQSSFIILGILLSRREWALTRAALREFRTNREIPYN